MLLSPIGPLIIHLVDFYLLLARWISLWYTTLSYWPTFYPYGTLLFSTGPLDISMVHCYLLLIHWISQCYTTLFFWPTGYLYGSSKDVNECSNIRIFVFCSNIRIRFLNSNIHIFFHSPGCASATFSNEEL